RPRRQASLDRDFTAALEQQMETALDGLDLGFVEFARLEDFEVLARDIGERFLRKPPALPASAEQKDAEQHERHQRRHQRQDRHGHGIASVFILLAYLAVAIDDVFVAAQFFQAAGAAGVELV